MVTALLVGGAGLAGIDPTVDRADGRGRALEAAFVIERIAGPAGAWVRTADDAVGGPPGEARALGIVQAAHAEEVRTNRRIARGHAAGVQAARRVAGAALAGHTLIVTARPRNALSVVRAGLAGVIGPAVHADGHGRKVTARAVAGVAELAGPGDTLPAACVAGALAVVGAASAGIASAVADGRRRSAGAAPMVEGRIAETALVVHALVPVAGAGEALPVVGAVSAYGPIATDREQTDLIAAVAVRDVAGLATAGDALLATGVGRALRIAGAGRTVQRGGIADGRRARPIALGLGRIAVSASALVALTPARVARALQVAHAPSANGRVDAADGEVAGSIAARAELSVGRIAQPAVTADALVLGARSVGAVQVLDAVFASIFDLIADRQRERARRVARRVAHSAAASVLVAIAARPVLRAIGVGEARLTNEVCRTDRDVRVCDTALIRSPVGGITGPANARNAGVRVRGTIIVIATNGADRVLPVVVAVAVGCHAGIAIAAATRPVCAEVRRVLRARHVAGSALLKRARSRCLADEVAAELVCRTAHVVGRIASSADVGDALPPPAVVVSDARAAGIAHAARAFGATRAVVVVVAHRADARRVEADREVAIAGQAIAAEAGPTRASVRGLHIAADVAGLALIAGGRAGRLAAELPCRRGPAAREVRRAAVVAVGVALGADVCDTLAAVRMPGAVDVVPALDTGGCGCDQGIIAERRIAAAGLSGPAATVPICAEICRGHVARRPAALAGLTAVRADLGRVSARRHTLEVTAELVSGAVLVVRRVAGAADVVDTGPSTYRAVHVVAALLALAADAVLELRPAHTGGAEVAAGALGPASRADPHVETAIGPYRVAARIARLAQPGGVGGGADVAAADSLVRAVAIVRAAQTLKRRAGLSVRVAGRIARARPTLPALAGAVDAGVGLRACAAAVVTLGTGSVRARGDAGLVAAELAGGAVVVVLADASAVAADQIALARGVLAAEAGEPPIGSWAALVGAITAVHAARSAVSRRVREPAGAIAAAPSAGAHVRAAATGVRIVGQVEVLIDHPIAVVVLGVAQLNLRDLLALTPALQTLHAGAEPPVASAARDELFRPSVVAGHRELVVDAVAVIVIAVADLAGGLDLTKTRAEHAVDAEAAAILTGADVAALGGQLPAGLADVLVDRRIAVLVATVAVLGARQHLTDAGRHEAAFAAPQAAVTVADVMGLDRAVVTLGEEGLTSLRRFVRIAVAVFISAVASLLGGQDGPPTLGQRAGRAEEEARPADAARDLRSTDGLTLARQQHPIGPDINEPVAVVVEAVTDLRGALLTQA